MLKKAEIQSRIDVSTEMFKKDVGSSYLAGIIVAYREMLGEDSSKVLKELHAMANAIRDKKAQEALHLRCMIDEKNIEGAGSFVKQKILVAEASRGFLQAKGNEEITQTRRR